MARFRLKPQSSYVLNNSCRLINGGKEYFDVLVRLIDSAARSIHLQVYIFEADETGNLVADALIAAARRRVDVYVLCDGYASSVPAELVSTLQANGVHIRFFEPILKSSNFYFGRRLHQKLAVFDGESALVGGINISNKYNDFGGQAAWLDWAVYIEGRTATDLLKVCLRLWSKSRVKGRKLFTRHSRTVFEDGIIPVRVRRNDWVRGKIQITASYIEMLRNAEHELIIMSSYFMPGKAFVNALIAAANRGISIKIILAGRSDIITAKLAERYLYPLLFKHNIEIYEYQRSILHGKIAAYDRKWFTIGSYNVNNISAYASIELNLDIAHPECAMSVYNQLETIIRNDCLQVTGDSFLQKYSLLERFVQWLAYQVVRIMVRAGTFYFKQGI